MFGLGWNIFRYLADFTHLLYIVLLLYKMISKKTCVGVSLKTHILYLSVYLFRYCNSGFFAPPLYNTCFKIFYIVSAIVIIVLVKFVYKRTYENRQDNFRILFIYIICLPLAYFTAPRKTLFILCHSYSLWIEAFAIVPQFLLIVRSRKVDVMGKDYVFLLSIYRLLYVINWIYKAFTETGKTPLNVWLTGIIQTLIYSDFIYEYIKMKVTGGEFELPY